MLDLNLLLAARRLDPIEVKLGDSTYMVNTDLTGTEVQTFLTLMQKGHDASAFTLLVGSREDRQRVVAAITRATKANLKNPPKPPVSEQAEVLNAYVDALPRMHQALVSGAIMRASKALAEFAKTDDEIYEAYGYGSEPVGESTAS
ncbi:MAG: hypothetical protein WBA97_34575 [Actinophytocola sp.]